METYELESQIYNDALKINLDYRAINFTVTEVYYGHDRNYEFKGYRVSLFDLINCVKVLNDKGKVISFIYNPKTLNAQLKKYSYAIQ